MAGVCHAYNLSWFNERTVELAVANDFLADRGDDGLEVGNVLGHYSPCAHRVVDRYERPSWYQVGRQWVDNIDVFDASGVWPWVVTISTLEHVGFDTPPFDAGAAPRALHHLRRLLAPGGVMLATFPTGFNPALDELVVAGATGAFRSTTLVRVDAERWAETDEPAIVPYGSRDAWAASVFIGEFGPVDGDAKGD